MQYRRVQLDRNVALAVFLRADRQNYCALRDIEVKLLSSFAPEGT